NWGPAAWIWTFGGQLVDETSIRPTATLPNNIRAFEWLRMWADSYGNRSPVPNNLATGTVAMMTGSTSNVGAYLNDGQFEFTTGRVPNPPGGQNGTWGGGWAVAVPYNSPQMVEALKLLRFFGEADV